MRRRLPARAAPGCPEINEHRNFAVANNFVKFLGVHGYGRFHRRQRCFASTASSYVRKVFSRNSVWLSASWAISDYGHSWVLLLNAARTVFRERGEYDNSGKFSQDLAYTRPAYKGGVRGS
jgi:hypothetical protein